MTNAARIKALLGRGLQRGSLVALALVTLIVAALFTSVYAMLSTERGTQWALQTARRFAPALSLVDVKGSFLHGIHAKQIHWRDADIDITLDRIDMQLRFADLLRGQIHFAALHIGTVNITPLGTDNGEPVKLPLIISPLVLAAPDLRVEQLNIINTESTLSLQNIRSALEWRATTLALEKTHVQWNDISVDASGNIGFRGNYPLRITGTVALPQLAQPLRVSTDGDLRNFNLFAEADAPAKLRAQITLATLEKNLPLKIHAELREPFTSTIGEEKITIATALLDAHGDLTQIQAQLALTASETRSGASQLTATGQWRDDKRVTLDAQWLPSRGRLQLHCDGSVDTPMRAECQGEAAALSLAPALSLIPALHDGNADRWSNAEISSRIMLAAKWLDPQWTLAVQLPNITGKYNADLLSGALDLRTDNGTQWQLPRLELALGPNTIKASGEFGDQHRLRANINATDLTRLDARLSGSVRGDIDITGNEAPTVSAHLLGTLLRWQDWRIATSAVKLELAQLGKAPSTAHVELQKVSRAESAPANLTLAMSGEQLSQQWTLRAEQSNNHAALSCRTQNTQNWQQWQFICNDFSGELRTHGKPIELTLRNTTALRGSAHIEQKRFELAPFCLRDGDIDICLDESLRITQAQLQTVSAHVHGLPLRWAEHWLPESVELLGDPRLGAQIQLRSVTPLNAQASVDVPATHWRWRTLKSTETTDIDAIHVDANLDEQRALFATRVRASGIGEIGAHLAVTDPRGKRTLDGNIAIEQMQLSSIAWAFEGLDAISGEIDGDIGIGGSAAAPLLRGQVLLKNGNALWAPLGAPFRNVHADLTFDNNSAKLGGWFALGQGGGDIDGNIVWNSADNDWTLRLGLIAGGVSAMPLPNSTIVFSPHTELTAKPGEMHIDGYVDIASADIRLKELPPATTDVSQDQEIVGQKLDEDEWKIWSKIDLNLGDQFHLNGFGADVNLSGRLRLEKAPSDNMHLFGEVRVPRGRYRAYGQRLTVRKGSVIFYGPMDNPDLNLEAVRDLPPGNTDVVGMRVIGSLKTPEAILFSEPAMTDSDIAYYLLTGRKPVANSTGTGGFTASGALLSLGLAGSESKAGQLAEKFGITDLQLGTSEGTNGDSEAEISGQLGKDLYVRYGRGLGEKSNSISFQYRLTPRLMIETISGIEDALDLLYSFEIK